MMNFGIAKEEAKSVLTDSDHIQQYLSLSSSNPNVPLTGLGELNSSFKPA
jgi:hypothetical protein